MEPEELGNFLSDRVLYGAIVVLVVGFIAVSALMAAMGRNVPIDQEKVVAGNRVLGHRPSILQDLLAGRPMEVDALYTTPLELAEMVGVTLPTLETLVGLIKVRARQAGLYNG